MKNAHITAVMNEKGGVGKTATATTLAYLLATKHKYKVALIDFDGQAHSTIIFGQNPNRISTTIYTLLNKIINEESLPDTEDYMIHTASGVDLIPANSRLFTLERTLCNIDFRETKLKEYTDTIKNLYDYIIIDCMPQMGTPMVNVMMAAGEIIIPTQTELLSVQGIGGIYKHCGIIQKNGNPDIKIGGILITMDNKNTSLSAAITATLKKGIGGNVRIFDSRIPRSVKVGESCIHSKTICEYQPKNPAALAYQAFTDEYLNCQEVL